jgi:hypothetical protein
MRQNFSVSKSYFPWLWTGWDVLINGLVSKQSRWHHFHCLGLDFGLDDERLGLGTYTVLVLSLAVYSISNPERETLHHSCDMLLLLLYEAPHVRFFYYIVFCVLILSLWLYIYIHLK